MRKAGSALGVHGHKLCADARCSCSLPMWKATGRNGWVASGSRIHGAALGCHAYLGACLV